MTTKRLEKTSPKFFCEKCDFKCFTNTDWNRHIARAKHIKTTNNNDINLENFKPKYVCVNCEKEYNDRAGLWRHKKKCPKEVSETNKEVDISDKNLIITLIQQNQELQKQNNELQKQMLEVIKNGTTNINNSMNNSNNKTFNLQVFLNETCKDAMNIMDFVDSIKIQLSDIESIGELGYVNGMSKLIIKHLNALDENMRPVHCSDPKRDSLYVKDQNVWEKEDPDNKKIKKAIKYISHKNICALPEWRSKYPDCIYSDSLKSDQYNHIVLEAMGGSGDNDAEKADKIVKKIAKEVTINK